jgi:hypothetical protein
MEEIVGRIHANKEGEVVGWEICDHLIYDDNGRVICRLHPMVNNGIEKRHYWLGCINEFLCVSAREFEKLPTERRKQVLGILGTKRLDPFEYAQKMRSGEAIKILRR